MELNYVLDTNVAIYLQKGALAEALPYGRYFISVITEIELISFLNLTDEQGTGAVGVARRRYDYWD